MEATNNVLMGTGEKIKTIPEVFEDIQDYFNNREDVQYLVSTRGGYDSEITEMKIKHLDIELTIIPDHVFGIERAFSLLVTINKIERYEAIRIDITNDYCDMLESLFDIVRNQLTNFNNMVKEAYRIVETTINNLDLNKNGDFCEMVHSRRTNTFFIRNYSTNNIVSVRGVIEIEDELPRMYIVINRYGNYADAGFQIDLPPYDAFQLATAINIFL